MTKPGRLDLRTVAEADVYLGDDLAAHLVRESADTISFTYVADSTGKGRHESRKRTHARSLASTRLRSTASKPRPPSRHLPMHAGEAVDRSRPHCWNCLKPWCFLGLSATGTCTAKTCRSTTPTVFGNPLRFTTYSAPSPIHAGEIPWRSTSTVAPTGSSVPTSSMPVSASACGHGQSSRMIDAVVEAAQDWPDKCGEIGFDDHQTTLLEKMLRTRIESLR